MTEVDFEENSAEAIDLDRDFLSGTYESRILSPGELRHKRNQLREVLLSSHPPARWSYIGRWFRFGIGIFLLLSLLLSSVACSSSAATVSWQDAAGVVPDQVLQQVVRHDTELDPAVSVKDVQAWVVDGRAGKLAVFDFNSSGICGVSGCLYTAYLLGKNKPPTQVFSSYLHPDLPPGRSLFSLGESSDTDFGLPCLQVTQPEAGLLRQSSYCYNGGYYQLSRSSLLQTTKDKKPAAR